MHGKSVYVYLFNLLFILLFYAPSDTEVRSKATRCDPNPCQNNGICRDDDKKIDGFVCSCVSDFTGKHCQVSKEDAQHPLIKKTKIVKNYEKKDDLDAFTNGTFDEKRMEDSKENISLLYQNLGCFKDDPDRRDLIKKVDLERATQEDCAKACAMEDKKYSYFGLQHGTKCFCDMKYGRYGKVADEDCSLKCEGNPNENCGGDNENVVFFFGLGTNYTVKTYTGRKPGAGTDANIYVKLIGERGSSNFRQLDNKLDKYEPGSFDQQMFTLPDLGKLKRMKILHDNSGAAPSWYLKKIEVTNEEGENFIFDCNDWLSDTQGGGKLERELTARSTVATPTTT